ncbi:transmembrane protein, putative (macronuclear) [Tetrahymena thermophila SB210]|uniref:Transmembrane protein, putative n=1 Tax=Tetrahymena thermophila (strain SB210) TaxID=312017 RepID=Q22AL8_TETTS|nr:transmembrane protein, putative [Tetrahymena thermophila SB210]EAR82338.2 transmembrane protein, putative [Tetrahymena thermophila SB210]|eukprot:XP_001030001.2 transmembrane protein, putative [Tetrahymena thermophila SB210]
MRMLFQQTARIKIEQPYRSNYGQNKLFMFVLQNEQKINLPLNIPVLEPDQSYPPTLITYSPLDNSEALQNASLTSYQNITYQSNEIFWKSKEQIAIPYIPYMSNCKGSGQFIYLHEYIEDPNYCELQTPQNTIPIRQIEFKQIPVSDICEEIKFQCSLDEAFNDNNNFPKFYQQNKEAELFFITQNPINIDTDLTGENSIKSLSLIPIVTKNIVPSSTLPKTITLEINYYQVDKYTKKIITAEMSFGSFIEESSNSSSSNFQFNFILSFHSMSHSELAIAFALEWQKKLNSVRHYIKLYQPILSGVILGVSFSFLVQSIASIAMLGGFWGYSIAPCEMPTTDSVCETSILEVLNSTTITQYIRRGRLGYTLIVIGIYGCIRITGVFFPSSTQDRINKNVDDCIKDSSGQQQKLLKTLNKLKERDKMMVTEFYDGNIWQERIWKRGQYLYMSIIVWTIMLIILHLSFSAFYAQNIWLFTALLKITQIFIQESLKVYMENELLTSSFNCVIATTLIVSGLGALDFYEYLFTYFVSLGISTFEKTNQVILVHHVSHRAFKFVKIFKKWIQKQFQYETNEDESTQSQNNDNFGNTIDDETDNQNKKLDDNSEVLLSERYEESMDTYDANFDQQSFKTYGQLHLQDLKTENNENMFSSTKKRINFADIQQVNELIQQAQTEEDQQQINQNESFDEFEDKFQRFLDHKITKSFMKSHPENEKQKTQEQEYKENGSQIIKVYTDFCNCSLTMLQAPFQIVQMWMFYDASQTFIRWRIKKAGLVFYLLFNVSNIPFQIVMDILLLKSVEQLHQLYIYDYVNQVRQRYQNRKYNWKRDDENDFLKMVEKEVQYIDIWCYSSQYFFCQSLFLGSSMVVINGFLTVLANKYNFLSDEYLVTITILWIIVCFLVDTVLVYIYDHISLWKVEDKIKSKQQKLNEDVIDEIKLTEQQLIPTEHLIKDQQQLFQVTEVYTRDFNNLTADKKCLETIEDIRQHNMPNNIFSRDNIIFKQSSVQEKLIKMQQNHRFGNNAKFSKGYLEFEKKFSLLNQLPDSSQSDFERQQNFNFSHQASQKIYQILNEQNNEFSELKQLIQKNKYIKMFFLDAIGMIKQSDLRIQNYLLELFEEKETLNINLEMKFVQIADKYRKQDPEPYKKLQKWLNIRESIKKSVVLKNKILKLKELMPKLENNEYKNEQFKINFLNVNKKWFQKNIKLLFEDLMKGDSKNQLKKNRQLILSGFKSIYGKLKLNRFKGDQISNEQKVESSIKWFETNSQKTSFKNAAMIVRYWLLRSRVQTLAEKCVSAYMLQGEGRCCIYCKSSQSITKQIQNSNIEDLFLKFYKRECRKYRQYLNVFQIVNGITKQKGKLISHGSSRRQTKKFDDFLPLDNFQDSIIEHQTEQKSYFLSRQQKFIESWQEYFFLNAKFIYVCLKCNDIAQNEYLQIVSKFRKWSVQMHLLEINSQRNNIIKEKDEESEGQLNNSYQINSSLLISNFALHKESYSKDELTPKNNEQVGQQFITDSIFHPINPQQNKYQNTVQAENQVIKEENNEDQSQADRTNYIDQEFFSPQPQRKKSSINSMLSLRVTKSSTKPQYPQSNNQSPYKLSQLGINNSQKLENQPLIQLDIKHEGINSQNYDSEKQGILQPETNKDQKDCIDDQKTSRSAKSIQKTHPEPSQNNLDDIKLKDNTIIDQQIQLINKNLEMSQNRSFRLVQTEKQKVLKDQEQDFLQVINSEQLQKSGSQINFSEFSPGVINLNKKFINIFQENNQNESKFNQNNEVQSLKQYNEYSQNQEESSSYSSEKSLDKNIDGF